MSTNGMESWAVDLAEVGAIYPFQGTELILLIAGLIFWIWFHVAQAKAESRELDASVKEFEAEEANRSIDRF